MTRASDPPVPCGDRLLFVLLLNILDVNTERDGWLRCKKNKSPNVFLSSRYRVARATASDLGVVKNEGTTLP